MRSGSPVSWSTGVWTCARPGRDDCGGSYPQWTTRPPREPVAPQPGPEDQLLASERGRHIAAAVARLPLRQRTVFTLCQVAGLGAGEVSQTLGLSESTVRVHLFRALRKLRELLEQERS